MKPPVDAILLAAGKSERMGTPKALLAWDGGTLAEYLARTLLSGGARRIFAVIGPGEVGERITRKLEGMDGVETVVNLVPERGMLSSVQAALARIPEETAFLACPCDLPKLSGDQVRAVIQGWDGSANSIVAPERDGKRGHPTLFGPGLRESALSLDSTVFGLNELLKRFPSAEIPCNADGPFRDADTPAAWAALTGRERM